jgi:hypothetical protein
MAEQKTRGAGRISKGAAGATGTAGETLKKTGSTASEATGAVTDAAPTDALRDVQDQGQGAAGGLLESTTGGRDRERRDQPTVREELAAIVRETAIEILGPVARNATRQAAKYAVRRGPQLVAQNIAPRVKDTLGPAIEEAGGPGELAKGALSKVSQRRPALLSKVGIGRERGEGSSQPGTEGWRVPVEESIDVAVPLETAYDQFTDFEEFAKFISQGERIDERPNERIAWRSTDGTEASGVITFHRLSDRLTRVMVTYDAQPHGLLGKTTSALRMSGRKLRADLMRFKAFVEMMDAEQAEEAGGQPAVEEREPRRSVRAARRRPRAEPIEEEAEEEAEPYDEADYDRDEEPEAEEEEQPVAPPRRVRTRAPARPRPTARQRR